MTLDLFEMNDEREQMANFVRGLLEKMPLSSLKQRNVREKYREKYHTTPTNKTPMNTNQTQMLREVVLEVAQAELSKEKERKNL